METLADKPSESFSSQNTWAEEEGGGGVTSLGDARLDSPESYDGNGSESTAHNETPLPTDTDSTTSSSRLKKLLKRIWRTNFTEDTSHSRELYIKLTLRELIIYLVFLVDLCIITFGMVNSNMFYFTNVMRHVFVETTFGPSAISFNDIGSVEDYWNYIRGPLLTGLYDNQWYNGDNFTSAEQGYIYYENKLLGVPRLRSLRVRNDSCSVPGDFQEDIPFCYDEYTAASEDHAAFGLANGTAWTYQSADQLQGSSYTGLVTSYGGGGYVQDLGTTYDTSSQFVNELMSYRWIDRGTRVAFADFTVYNANVNLFCVMRLIVEFPATGGAIASVLFQTVKLIRYVSAFDYFVLVCEIIFILFFVYYVIEESIEIACNRLAYFKSFWNVVDIVVVATAACVIAFNIHRTVIVNNLLTSLLQRPDVFADFSSLSYWQYVFNVLIAVLVFLAWLKLFKFIAFNRTMTHLSSTLSRAAKDVASYAVMFFIIFFAFAQLGYLLFGSHLRDFCSFGDSVFTLFRIVLGDFDFMALQSAHRVLGPLFFVLYVFFIYFVLINMFLAIINDTYTDVKDELAEEKGNMEVTDYLKQKYNLLVKRLTERKQKKQEHTAAVQAAKTSRPGFVANSSNMVDVGEWKRGLKMQGYTEAELEAACARCDVDAGHMIDKKDLARLSRELSRKQHVAMDDSDDDDSDDDERSAQSKSTRSGGGVGGRLGGSGMGGVSNEEFSVLTRRVDRMEHSIGSIVSKIDAVLVKLEALERTKAKRRETTIRALGSITEAEGRMDESRRTDMERHVLDELERWDSESSLGVASVRGLSPGCADRHASTGTNKSRPTSMHIDSNV